MIAYTNRYMIKCMRNCNQAMPSRMTKIRSKTVEPVLGHLLNYLGMKRIQSRGIRAAVKHVLMASLCHNLKRLMKYQGDHAQSHVNCLEKALKRAIYFANLLFFILTATITGQIFPSKKMLCRV
jgi:hypothetical protein